MAHSKASHLARLGGLTLFAAAMVANTAEAQVRPEIGAALDQALAAVDHKDFPAAFAKVHEAGAISGQTPAEEYAVARVESYAALAEPKPDFDLAMEAYNRQVASGAAPAAEQATMYSVALRLNFAHGNYQEAARDGAALKKLQPLSDSDYPLLIQAYAKSGDADAAEREAKAAVEAAGSGGTNASGLLLSLLYNTEIAAGDASSAQQTLDRLAAVSDKPEIWRQVIASALSDQSLTDHQKLNLYRLGAIKQVLDGADFVKMGKLSLGLGFGHAALLALTKSGGMAQAPEMAAAKAMAERELRDPGQGFKAGEDLMARLRFAEAVRVMKAAIADSGSAASSDAQTTLAIAQLLAGDRDAALASLKRESSATGAAGHVAWLWCIYAAHAPAGKFQPPALVSVLDTAHK